MSKTSLSLITGVLLAACSPPPKVSVGQPEAGVPDPDAWSEAGTLDAPEVVGGARLTAHTVTFDGADGPAFVGIFDRALGTDCAFHPPLDFPAPVLETVKCRPAPFDPSQEGAWADGRLVLASRPGRIAAREVLSADGQRFPWFVNGAPELVDTATGESCTAVGDRCLPPYAYFFGVFEDAACRVPLAVWFSGPPVPALAVLDEGSDASTLAASPGPHALGPEWTKPTFKLSTTGCEAALPDSYPDNWVLYQIGVALDPTTFGVLRPATRGAGRLALQIYEDDSGVIAGRPNPSAHASGGAWFVDRDLGVPCTPVQTPDAGVRCVGGIDFAMEPATTRFADAACRVPVYINEAGGTPTDRVAVLSLDLVPLPRATRILEIGASVGNRPFVLKDEGCVETLNKFDAHLFGESTWGTFAPLQEHHD